MSLISPLWAAPAFKRTALALFFLSSVGWVQAQTWDGGAGTSNWSDANNWSTNTVPASNASVTIGNFNVNVNGNYTCGSLTLNNGTSNAVNVVSVGTNTLTVTGTITFSVGGSANTKAQLTASTGTINAGAVSFSSGGSKGQILFSGAGNLNITAGDFSSSGTFSAGTSTVTYNRNGSQNVGAYTYNNLVFSTGASGSTKTLAGDVTVSDALTINSNTTLDVSDLQDYDLSVGGNWTNNGTFNAHEGTVFFNGTGAGNQLIGATSTFYNVTFSGNKTKTSTGALTITNNFTINSSSNFTAGGALNISNDVTINTGSNFTAGNFTHTVGDDWTKSSTATFNATGSTINFNGNNGSFSTQSISASNFNNITFSNSSTKAGFGAFTITGNVLISSNFIAGDYTHTVAGNWTNNGSFTDNNSTVNFNGAAAQTIGGSASSVFNKITIANTNGGVSITKTATVSSSATFTTGIVSTTASALLSFASATTVSGASNASHVNGPVQKIGTNAFVFPVGKNGKYVPIGIGAAAASNTFTAEYIPSSGSAKGPITAPGVLLVSNCEYWQLDRTSGTSNVDVTLYYNSANNACSGDDYITDPSTLRVVHFNGSSWDATGGTGTGSGSPTTTATITWTGVSTFSPFTIGTTNTVLNPLPVHFVLFEGRGGTGGTELSWKVGSETNLKGYNIERKEGSGQFTKIGFVAATGGSRYSFTDAAAHGSMVAYRIKTVDQDGRVGYSTILTFQNGKGAILFQVFPTVVSGKATVQHEAAGAKAVLVLSDMNGKQVKAVKPQSGALQTDVDMAGLRPGVYLLKWTNGSGRSETVKLVKQ